MLHHQHTNTNTREAPQSDVFFPWKRNCIFTCEKATTTSNPWQQVATSSAGGGTSGGTSFNKVSLRFWPEALPRNHFQNEDRFSLYHCIFVIHLHVYIYVYYICMTYYRYVSIAIATTHRIEKLHSVLQRRSSTRWPALPQTFRRGFSPAGCSRQRWWQRWLARPPKTPGFWLERKPGLVFGGIDLQK